MSVNHVLDDDRQSMILLTRSVYPGSETSFGTIGTQSWWHLNQTGTSYDVTMGQDPPLMND